MTSPIITSPPLPMMKCGIMPVTCMRVILWLPLWFVHTNAEKQQSVCHPKCGKETKMCHGLTNRKPIMQNPVAQMKKTEGRVRTLLIWIRSRVFYWKGVAYLGSQYTWLYTDVWQTDIA